MINTTLYAGSQAMWAGGADVGALHRVRTFTERCAVSPTQAPSTGEVRPRAGNDVLIVTPLFDKGKGDVCVRSLGPPI